MPKDRWIPAIFVVLQAAMCVIVWDAWYSVFVLLGICINTYCMSLSDAQLVRKSIILTSPMVFTYDAFASSVGGMIYEAVAWISSLIGIFRNRGKSEQKGEVMNAFPDNEA